MICGIGYKARSGKDTIANYLVQEYGFKRRAFADALKEGAAVIFGLSHEQLYGELKEVQDSFWQQTPRYILQKMGTECMRDGYDKNIWCSALQRHIINNAPGSNINWVVPDVRFENEAVLIKKMGGVVWRVDRPDLEDMGIVGHASETAMDGYMGWDRIITNDGTIEDMCLKIKQIMEG